MDYSKDDILTKAYIYIIYPSNYDVNNISTRQFYIGSSDNITKSRSKFYEELYSQNTSKKIMTMKNYMTSKDVGISIKKDKETFEDKKFWQLRPIFMGFNCCTKPLLKTLEGLYIYYYYSVLNDVEVNFDPDRIPIEQLAYFKYLDICNHLSKCYSPFEYDDLLYDVNPYTLISKDNCNLSHNLHIYKEICDRISIPKFESFDKINFQCLREKTVDEFYNEFNNDYINLFMEEANRTRKIFKSPKLQEPNIYWFYKEPLYKCYYCDQKYTRVHKYLCEHLEKKHNIIVSLEKARSYLP